MKKIEEFGRYGEVTPGELAKWTDDTESLPALTPAALKVYTKSLGILSAQNVTFVGPWGVKYSAFNYDFVQKIRRHIYGSQPGDWGPLEKSGQELVADTCEYEFAIETGESAEKIFPLLSDVLDDLLICSAISSVSWPKLNSDGKRQVADAYTNRGLNLKRPFAFDIWRKRSKRFRAKVDEDKDFLFKGVLRRSIEGPLDVAADLILKRVEKGTISEADFQVFICAQGALGLLLKTPTQVEASRKEARKKNKLVSNK